MTEKFSDDHKKSKQPRPESSSAGGNEINDGIDEWEEERKVEPKESIEYGVEQELGKNLEIPETESSEMGLAESLDQDPRFRTIVTELIKSWEEANNSDIYSSEGQNFLYGVMTQSRVAGDKVTVRQRAQKVFFERFPDDAKQYSEQEKARIYKNPEDDPAIKERLKIITRVTNQHVTDTQNGMWGDIASEEANGQKYGEVWNRNFNQVSDTQWGSFVLEYPEKAEAYREMFEPIKGAFDEKEKLQLRQENVAADQSELSLADELLKLEYETIDIEDRYNRGEFEGDEYNALLDDLETKKANLESGTEFVTKLDKPELEEESEPVVAEEEVVLSPEQQEKAEYLRLKREFKESQEAYFDALEKDYANRNGLKKIFGIGRGSMNSEVQSAYNAFMTSNKAYYEYAKTSGTYQKIAERLNRDNQPTDEQVSIVPLVAERHVLIPAEQRLEIQSTLMPEKVKELKNKLVEKIKNSQKFTATSEFFKQFNNNPNFAKVVGFAESSFNNPTVAKLLGYSTYGYSAYRIYNTTSAAAGMAVNYATGKIAGRLDDFSEKYVEDKMGSDDFDLEKLEAEYFDNIRFTQGLRTAGKIGAVGATMGMGGTLGSFDDFSTKLDSLADKIPTIEDIHTLADKLPTAEEIGGGVAKLHEQSNAFNDTVIQPEINSVVESAKSFVAENVPEGVDIEVPTAAEMNDAVNNWANEQSVGSVTESTSPPVESAVSIPESAPVIGEAVSKIELVHTVEGGDTTSSILLNGLKEKVTSREFELPKGVDIDHLSHYLYQNFPELTSASGVEPKLTPQEWIDIGVKSGDPNKIFPGQDIDVGALLEKLRVHPADNTLADLSLDVSTTTVVPTFEQTVSVESSSVDTIPGNLPTGILPAEVSNSEVLSPNDSSFVYTPSEAVASAEPTLPSESDITTESTSALSPADGGRLDTHYPFSNGELTINVVLEKMNNSIDHENLKLPEGVLRANLPQFFSSTFPEMFGLKEDQAPTLSPEYWKYLGISSGNPLEPHYGDTFNMQKFYRLALSWPQTDGDPGIQELLIKEIFKEELKSKLAGL